MAELRSFSQGVLLAFAILVISATPIFAQTLASPEGEIVLSVTGDIEVKNSETGALFDMQAMKALPATHFETSTIWTEGLQTFRGVSLKQLVDLLKIKGTKLVASAINDYSVEIPLEVAVDGGPIVAYEMNGSEMPRRDKGPLWIVFPYDQNPDYRTEATYSQSIWQLDRIAVE